MAPAQIRGQLARAGWHICSQEQLAKAKAPPVEYEKEGSRLIVELARLWSNKYDHHITSKGSKNGAYHYECIFSQPLNETPVPINVVYSYFALLLPVADGKPEASSMPRLLFSFEESDLRHEWKLHRGTDGRLHVDQGPQDMSLRHGYFEEFLNTLIEEKSRMKARGIDLVTSFESTRLPCPDDMGDEGEEPGAESDEDEDVEQAKRGSSASLGFTKEDSTTMQEMDPEMAEAMKKALREAGLACESVPPPSSLTELLANVFDAADEENSGELSHYDVSRLLGATLSGLGLQSWDIQLLMTSAQENTNGYIELKPFSLQAPEVIWELRRRRLNYSNRGYPKTEVHPDAVKHCYGAEISETAEALIALITQRCQDDPTCAKSNVAESLVQGLMAQSASNRRSSRPGMPAQIDLAEASIEELEGMFRFGIRRSECRECIMALPTRISPQEANRLMQMLPEDEDCFLGVDTLEDQLEELRTGALHNCLVESDPLSLRKHLVINFRHLGLTEEGSLKVWQLKHALLAADQICLSRLQIHMLLCLATPYTDLEGNVDVRSFSAVLGAVIPHMLDAETFSEIAERLQVEAAELQRMRENAELAALGASKLNDGDEKKEKTQEVEVDQESVEKILIQALGEGRGPTMLLPEGLFAALYAGDQQIQSCQLSEFELGGLAAEMTVDSKGEVAYVDHIRQTVPMIFELRRSQLLCQYVQPDGLATLGITIPTPDEVDAIFPLVPPSLKKEQLGQGSGKRKSSKRRSKEPADRSMQLKGSLGAMAEGGRRNSIGGKLPVPTMVGGRGYERRKLRMGLEEALNPKPEEAKPPNSSRDNAPASPGQNPPLSGRSHRES